MVSSRRTRALIGVATVSGAIAIIALGCDDEHRRTAPGQVLGGGGGACEAKPGDLPTPNCDNSSNACSPIAGCTIDEVKCGSKSTCLPLADNKEKDVVDLRFRRLNIAAPPALAATFIQNTVVNSGIELDEKTCAETGRGLFTWILRLDKNASIITTGGAPPSSDPFGLGFCFADFEINATKVTPVVFKIDMKDNTFKTVERENVNIPIFLSEALSSAIVLPITDARIEGVTLSADGNCIGTFHAAALDPSCTEDRDLCPKWTTGGSLGGFITLEQADAVKIKDLNNKSLCAFLASEAGLACARDSREKISYKGDYCSTDKQSGSCQDSVWLAATFAASAVKIFDGRGIVDGCSGKSAGPVDAGVDAPADAHAGASDE